MDMVDALLYRWPHLKGNLSDKDSKDLWHAYMKSSFKNQRRRHPAIKNCREVQEAREKFGKKRRWVESADHTNPTESQNATNVWGVKGFLPDIDPGEDERSIQNHIQFLQSQFKLRKDRQIETEINLRMEKTFAERRKMLINNMDSIQSITSLFPFLTIGDQV